MMKNKKTRLKLIVASALYVLSFAVYGGGETTSLSGLVTDPDGAMLSVVQITAQGVSPTTGTFFTFSNLDVDGTAPDTTGEYSVGVATTGGTYNVVAQKTGYRTTTVSNVVVAAGADTWVPVTMLFDGPDGDGDGLDDTVENSLGTNATLPDTDGDGFNDGIEVAAGTDPLDINDAPLLGDISNDGVVDIVDLLLCTRVTLGQTSSPLQDLCDIAPSGTPDGSLNAGDIAVIRRMAVGL